MARSLKKGPFADAHLLKKVDGYDGPGKQKYCFDIEHQKQNGKQVVTYTELHP